MASCECERLRDFVMVELGFGDEVQELFNVIERTCQKETEDIWTYKCRYKDQNIGEITKMFALCESCKRRIQDSGICV